MTDMATQTQPQQEAADVQGASAWRRRDSRPTGEVHWNLVAPVLIQHAARRGEGEFAEMGPFVAVTAPHTGRSPNDKFVVREPQSEKDVDWGKVNQPIAPDKFELLLADVRAYLERSRRALRRRISTAAPIRSIASSVRYVSPSAWHMAFVRNMFIRPDARRAARPSIRTSRCCTRPNSRPIRRSTARAPARSSCSTSPSA